MLTFEADSKLEAATRFLRKAHPLAHVAPIKKSQVRGLVSGGGLSDDMCEPSAVADVAAADDALAPAVPALLLGCQLSA